MVEALKHFIARYKAWIMAALAPLSGIWAVFVIALIDASIFGIPLDPIVAYYVAVDPRNCIVYAIMASAGSALGSVVPYAIGYKGGEALVVKRIGQRRFARIHGLSEKYGDLALIIPALMPPGFPFKAFVLMAGVTEMRYLHFTLAIFAGRMARFLGLGMLVIAYGPEILEFMMATFRQNRTTALMVIAAVVALIVLLVVVIKSRRGRGKTDTETSVA